MIPDLSVFFYTTNTCVLLLLNCLNMNSTYLTKHFIDENPIHHSSMTKICVDLPRLATKHFKISLQSSLLVQGMECFSLTLEPWASYRLWIFFLIHHYTACWGCWAGGWGTMGGKGDDSDSGLKMGVWRSSRSATVMPGLLIRRVTGVIPFWLSSRMSSFL